LSRSIDNLIEWNEKIENKKKTLREQSKEVEKEIIKLSSKKLICLGSEEINKINHRNELVKASGLSITDWLHLQAVERKKKKE